MGTTRKKILLLIAELDELLRRAGVLERRFARQIARVHPDHREGAANLLHYLALRHGDLRRVQRGLGELGVSRLGRAEGHVLASIGAIRRVLCKLVDADEGAAAAAVLPLGEGGKRLRRNTAVLLGKKRKSSRTRIMVTLPSEAASSYPLVRGLLKAGMSCARINCAHDDADAWGRMIAHVERARRATGRPCPVCMDLGGPKLRTGAMRAGPEVIHLAPRRGLLGELEAPAEVILAPPEALRPDERDRALAVTAADFAGVRSGDRVRFTDTRGKRGVLEIRARQGDRWIAECGESVYLATGTRLRVETRRGVVDTAVGRLTPTELKITLREGDTLILHRDDAPGEPATAVRPAHISCAVPEVFADVRPGHAIVFDDGAIEGVVVQRSPRRLTVRITRAREEGSKLRADKGINLPDTELSVSGLTAKDREDLGFVAAHADIVNLSFVNSAADVRLLRRALRKLGAEGMGVILKIETRSGLRRLPEILLAAMRGRAVGVMLARGDLAIECGWDHLAEIQEEILWICEAAHIPIVWATQVLETLAKKGVPSRAEISDAAMAERAECVMLNKGPHIVRTIAMLDRILRSVEEHRDKRAPMLPALRHLGIAE